MGSKRRAFRANRGTGRRSVCVMDSAIEEDDNPEGERMNEADIGDWATGRIAFVRSTIPGG